MKEICIKPVGVVKSSVNDLYSMPMGGEKGIIAIKDEYTPALHRIEENSHIWIISWFDQADRNLLQVTPRILGPASLKYGVFGVHCLNRPNPIAMSLVALEKIENNLLYVNGLDAINGTPVLDIKSYYENDSIFSPRTSYIKPRDEHVRRSLMYKLALRHHGKDSAALEIGLRICLTAETHFGHLFDPALLVQVNGSRELADVIQGITRAKLANPPRFTFNESDRDSVVFTKDGSTITFRPYKRFSEEEVAGLCDDELFLIEKNFAKD